MGITSCPQGRVKKRVLVAFQRRGTLQRARMIREQNTAAATWLLVACLSVVVITADAEGCAHTNHRDLAEAGMCPPIKIHVPYPGFNGNYGVNAMYHHAGVKRDTVWYQHAVPLSAEHPAAILMLSKAVGANGAVAWKLVRQ